MKVTKIDFPRKKKKKLKKMGLPYFLQIIEIENKTTSNLNSIMFGGNKYNLELNK